MAHRLTGTWSICWTQNKRHHNVHALSMGVLPLSLHRAQVLEARQVIDVEGGWLADHVKLEFDNGYVAHWSAQGLLTMKLREDAPIDVDVNFQVGRLASLDGTPPNYLAGYADRRLSMQFRRAHATVIVLTDISRIDRDQQNRLAFLKKEP